MFLFGQIDLRGNKCKGGTKVNHVLTVSVCSSSKICLKRGTDQFRKIVIYLLFLLIGAIKSPIEVSKEFSNRSLIIINSHARLITQTVPGAHSYSQGRPNWDKL